MHRRARRVALRHPSRRRQGGDRRGDLRRYQRGSVSLSVLARLTAGRPARGFRPRRSLGAAAGQRGGPSYPAVHGGCDLREFSQWVYCPGPLAGKREAGVMAQKISLIDDLDGSEAPSSRGEFHPPALTDPYVNLSVHTALVVLVTRLWGRSWSRPSGRSTVVVL